MSGLPLSHQTGETLVTPPIGGGLAYLLGVTRGLLMVLKGATPKGIGMGLMPLEKQVQVLAASKKDEPSKQPLS